MKCPICAQEMEEETGFMNGIDWHRQDPTTNLLEVTYRCRADRILMDLAIPVMVSRRGEHEVEQ